MLPMPGAWVQSLVGELDLACMPQLSVHMPQLRSPPATAKTWCNQTKIIYILKKKLRFLLSRGVEETMRDRPVPEGQAGATAASR